MQSALEKRRGFYIALHKTVTQSLKISSILDHVYVLIHPYVYNCMYDLYTNHMTSHSLVSRVGEINFSKIFRKL